MKYLLNCFDCFVLNKRVNFVDERKIAGLEICTCLLLKKDLSLCLWEMPLKIRELYCVIGREKTVLENHTFLNCNKTPKTMSILSI